MKTKTFLSLMLLCIFAQAQNGWQLQVSNTYAHLSDITFPAEGTGWAVGTDGTILHTTDEGAQWWAQSSSTLKNLNSVAFLDGSTGYAVGDNCTILYTSDAGIHWVPVDMESVLSQINTRQAKTSTNDLSGVAFNSPTTAFVVGDNGLILKVSQWGTILNFQVSSINKNLLQVKFCNEQRGWIVGEEGTILRTTDGGENWSVVASGTYCDLNSVCFCSPDKGFIAASGMIMCSVDSGNTFMPLPGMITDDYSHICFPSPTTGYCVTNSGEIFCSTDGGFTWTIQQSGVTTRLNSVCFCNPFTGWAVGNEGVIIHTGNGGWAGVDEESLPAVISIYPVPSGEMLTVDIDRAGCDVWCSVCDASGRTVIPPFQPQRDTQRFTLNIAGLAPGIYRLVLTNGRKITSRSFARVY